ncbi:glycosyltransferase family protein [Paenibacillus sp. y28]|uniref:glycosyltransferase family protein n=1 Tax=Paenibacillus sp. y28 TaxID=3129110 RepID=UPI00301ABED0
MTIHKGKKIAVIQSRISSSRLPGKALLDLGGKPLIEWVIERSSMSRLADEVWLATSTEPEDDILEWIGKQCGIRVYRGSLKDVLNRFCGVVEASGADIVVRITADNPLSEPRFIDDCIEALASGAYDYVYNDSIPHGTGVEGVRAEQLLALQKRTADPAEREHVTLHFYNHPELFSVKALPPSGMLHRPEIRVTVDTLEDYVRLYRILRQCGEADSRCLTLEQIISCYDQGHWRG